jgi:DNA polymerase/3'-5' exonuclease PolX
VKKRKSGGAPSSQMKVRKLYAANEEISKVFKKLAGLYQSCPLEKDDVWRAYQFRINAGRVMQLGFEISDDTLDKLKKDVVGFGDSCLEIISQYFESGGVERIKTLETEKSRVAMHKMMDIWGVGSKKVIGQML